MNKKFTRAMVDNYADKVLIGLSEEENSMVLEEFEEIDESIALVETIPNIHAVEPMSWCLDDPATSLREDVAEESVPIDELLANADGTSIREVEILKVVS